jgi:cytoskeleton protein RodZ
MTEPLSNNSSLDFLARELKTARLGKKLSLEDVSQLTRIQKHYLEQLEDGNFSFLPPGYVYACIKSYFRELGLDNSEALEQCKKELKLVGALNSGSVTNITTDFTAKKKLWPLETNRKNAELLKSILPLTIGIIVGVIGAVGFSYIDSNSSVSVHQPPVANAKISLRSSKSSVIKNSIDSSVFNQKRKKSNLTQSISEAPADPLLDISVSDLAPAPLRFSRSQK